MKRVKTHIPKLEQLWSRTVSQTAWVSAGWLVLSLGGCSVSDVVTDWNSDDVVGNEPINYRYVVATSLSGIIGRANPGDNKLEISPPRRANWPKGPVWLVCLKSVPDSPQRRPAYYGIAFQREKMWDSRLAVGADGCESQIYSEFDWKDAAAHPIPK
jgi:hypothetical protein